MTSDLDSSMASLPQTSPFVQLVQNTGVPEESVGSYQQNSLKRESTTFTYAEEDNFNRRIGMVASFQDNDGTDTFYEDEEIAAEDEDFVFIDEVITGYVRDMAQNEPTNDLITIAAGSPLIHQRLLLLLLPLALASPDLLRRLLR